MTQPVSALASGVLAAGATATAKVSLNTRVMTASAPIGVLSDVMQFPGPAATGNWLLGATRVQIMGVPAINQASTGSAFGPPLPSAAPMTVILGDPRVKAL